MNSYVFIEKQNNHFESLQFFQFSSHYNICVKCSFVWMFFFNQTPFLSLPVFQMHETVENETTDVLDAAIRDFIIILGLCKCETLTLLLWELEKGFETCLI